MRIMLLMPRPVYIAGLSGTFESAISLIKQFQSVLTMRFSTATIHFEVKSTINQVAAPKLEKERRFIVK